MARKAPTSDELFASLDELGTEEQAAPSKGAPAATSKPPAATATDDDDPLAELSALAAQRPASRPSTPRLSSSTTSATNKSPKRAEHTPASSGPPSGRNSEDRLRNIAAPRKSGESTRSFHQSFTPGTTQEHSPETPDKVLQAPPPPEPEFSKSKAEPAQQGGGWWGSMFSAASAAVKQAESLAKEIRSNEEAQRWAEQVKGNISGLQSFGTDLRTRALPTFTSLISHIAPPISAHERLQIHTTHDIHNYPSLDPLIYSTFSRIMSQVEGGDLLVIQRGSEQRSRARSNSDVGYRGGVMGGGSGWTDGPWWRDEIAKRDLGSVKGLREGTKLARVSAESYANEFFTSKGGLEKAAQQATETLNESNPVRSSDIFLAIQAVAYTAEKKLFESGSRPDEPTGVVDPPDEDEELVAFAVYLHDPIHSLSFSSLSQSFPQKWAAWLDASAAGGEDGGLPESIQEIVSSGGVDPREWVAEWMEEVLSLSVGVVAQRYVARRMGVGEGGLGRGKRRAEEEGVGGEAARAI